MTIIDDLSANELDLLNEISELDLLAVSSPRSPSLPHQQARHYQHQLAPSAPPETPSFTTSQTGFVQDLPLHHFSHPRPTLPAFPFAPHSQPDLNVNTEEALTAMVKPLVSSVMELLAAIGPHQAATLPQLSAMLSNPALYALLFQQ